MSEQITWTHVDKLVRKMLDDRMQMACGTTDAEVALDFIKFLEVEKGRLINSLRDLQKQLDIRTADCLRTKQALSEAQAFKPGKTKQRLAKLECQVSRLIALANQE